MKSIFLILFGGLLTAAAGDWRHFRGPHTSGVADESLPAKIESIAWLASLPGRGLSSPIVVGDRVFVSAASGPKQDRLHVLCFRKSDGALLWERQFWATGRTMTQEKTCVAAPTPASDGERVYAIFSSNDIVCLDLEGNLVWLRGLMRDYPNASNSLGMASSLLVADGAVIAMIENDSDSSTVGLNALTGVNLWKRERPKSANWTSPVLIPSPNGTKVGLQSGKGLLCVDPRTGQEIWNYGEGASTVSSTTASEGLLYAPSHGITALQPVQGEKSPKQLWRSAQLRPGTASPVAHRGRLYLLNDAGVMTCANAADGARLWQLRLKGPFSATPIAAGSFLYCVNETGLFQVVDISGAEGTITSELALNGTVLCTPGVSDGAIFLRSDANLWRLQGR